mmetsp:Transcript_35137/g.67149  ORF Transcript_35137/g.67149 Transcript_35137/m.67149 type:complete len:327 (+) Transcript_35137:1154-2134(+)
MVFPSSRAVPIHLLAGHRDPSWGRGPGAGWGARGRRRHPAAHYDILPRTSARTLAPSHRPARCTYRARITLPSSTNCAPRLHHHSCWRLSNLVSIPSWWRRSGRARRSAPGRCGPRRVALPARVARCVVAVAHARLGTPRGSGRFGKLGALSVAPLLLFHLGIHVRTTPRRPVALRLSGAWRHRPGRPLLPADRPWVVRVAIRAQASWRSVPHAPSIIPPLTSCGLPHASASPAWRSIPPATAPTATAATHLCLPRRAGCASPLSLDSFRARPQLNESVPGRRRAPAPAPAPALKLARRRADVGDGLPCCRDHSPARRPLSDRRRL